MILDARSFPQEHVVDTDVCILGGGVAGLTLAREFAGQHVDVCVLEQGGFDEETEAQKLNRGEVTGYPYWGLDYARHAQVGGSSHRWGLTLSDGRTGARFRPLDAIDFERRPEIPHSGWPFSKTELDPYYDRAQTLFHLGPNRYRPDEWEGADEELLFKECPSLETVLFQYGPRNAFTEWHRDAVAKAKNVTIIHHARVLSAETTQSGRTASHVRVAAPEGPEFAVRARTFVLALGGIENARLLLASNRTHRNGLGNQHDLVGRFFM